ncbi:TetR/AcrR family transcriptional regulator [Streptomyces sp. NPDC059866]|uniref:TetR/AcrR family transcriptional regulator n=1 Tax=Streptomyces sp. NPDC059866 TaxID=3346978 RepID=UPI00364DA3A2
MASSPCPPYLEFRHERSRNRITRTLTWFRTPREQMLGVFDALGEAFTEPGYNGCAFVRATAEAPEDSVVRRATDNYRAWVRGLFTELATASGYAGPEELARRLHLLYDGAEQSARMDRDPSAATTARAAAADLLDAAPLTGPATAGQSVSLIVPERQR